MTQHSAISAVEKHRRQIELSPGVGAEVQQYALAVCDDILADLRTIPSSTTSQPILTTATEPQGREVTQGEARLHHPAPEREGEIAARESLEPEGPATARLLVERAAEGRAERLDGGERPATHTPSTVEPVVWMTGDDHPQFYFTEAEARSHGDPVPLYKRPSASVAREEKP